MKKIFAIVLFALSVFVLTACNDVPDTIDFGIEWHFDASAPETLEEFAFQIREFNEEITKNMEFLNIFRVINW